MAFSLTAHWTGRSIYDIDPAALAKRGIRLLLADLDNTLVPYGVPVRGAGAHRTGAGVEPGIGGPRRHPLRLVQ